MLDTFHPQTVGKHLREWRTRRRLSQLELATQTEISARHLSFLETGRAKPSREMVLRLAEQLAIPLRDRNTLLVAAGFAPVFGERPLDDPNLDAARKAIDLILAGHEPYPALAIDRHWTLVTSNRAIAPFLESIDPPLLAPPINVLRVTLHPRGLASRIVNFVEWRSHLLARVRRQIDASADARLEELWKELQSYPFPSHAKHHAPADRFGGVAIPVQLATEQGILSFIGTTTVFGTPVDITLSELALEAFYPADARTGEALKRLAAR